MKRNSFYKKIPLWAGCLMACFTIGSPAAAQAQETTAPTAQVDTATGFKVKVGDMAPDFSLKLTDGSTFKLSEQRGKVVMLQFTASWCGVCRKEMPHIEEEIWQVHRDDPEFTLLGIDREEPLEKVQAFMKSVGTTYPMALDKHADVFASYADRESGITRNVLIDRKGRIIKLTRLYNPEEFEELVNRIEEALAEGADDTDDTTLTDADNLEGNNDAPDTDETPEAE